MYHLLEKMPLEAKSGKNNDKCVHLRHGVCRYGHRPCVPGCALKKTVNERESWMQNCQV